MKIERLQLERMYDQIEAGLRERIEDWFDDGGTALLDKIHFEMVDHCRTVQKVSKIVEDHDVNDNFSDMTIVLQAAATCMLGRLINERINRSEDDD